jgi:pyruvate kinase|mmetsp:Transcript_17924/g.26113  ORF Transcript_17924/g.26113 Transcript_17924/m.26113 type:complete len:503 (-) Transcript_17924:555-2063(-)|eukprot:CAMPEP_0113934840 /NCGR_PEP_ID=MMETSP1339-20121228/2096_1 /TAXON_ID=94617 /ORGANISM="Fibrocapsa japonica" /LENGTH=502 /DNA_ID=CAMNT_0000936783 /DNA_START=87 /DNA_END=1595 /DNA_ORIENTATION=+ /assembly_acc=CAM_ASM_000762
MANELRGKGYTLEKIFTEIDTAFRRVKIVATVGPACSDVDKLVQMIDLGVNIFRMNFSHGDHESHGMMLDNIRQAITARPRTYCAVLLDTKGPEIRTGFLEDHKAVTLTRGQKLELTTDYTFLGNKDKIACSYQHLPRDVSPGKVILAADGGLSLTVLECKESSVIVRVENDTVLGEKKNMSLPGIKVDLPTITDKDANDIQNFGVVQGVDFIALSFVRTGADIRKCREVLGDAGAHIKIFAKIEDHEGMENFDDILSEVDGIMVARGDLGMAIPPEKVFAAQKLMIRKCNIIGKPVITATQMLESMTKNPRPTRAECADVANAVLDGTDCVMLSGETAGGLFPLQAVEIMSRVCCEAEQCINYDKLYQAVRNSVIDKFGTIEQYESVASSAVKVSLDVNARMIVVLTDTGNTARLVAKYRPQIPIIAYTAMEETARQVQGYCRNVKAQVIGSMIGTESILFRAIDIGKQNGWVEAGDSVVCVHGMQEATAGSTNMLRILTA